MLLLTILITYISPASADTVTLYLWKDISLFPNHTLHRASGSYHPKIS